MENEPTDLYKHFDSDHRLLYVGVSLSSIARLRQHRQSDWYNDIAWVARKVYPTRAAALEAEREAIQQERPLHNKTHNPRHMLSPERTGDDGLGIIRQAVRVDVLDQKVQELEKSLNWLADDTDKQIAEKLGYLQGEVGETGKSIYDRIREVEEQLAISFTERRNEMHEMGERLVKNERVAKRADMRSRNTQKNLVTSEQMKDWDEVKAEEA